MQTTTLNKLMAALLLIALSAGVTYASDNDDGDLVQISGQVLDPDGNPKPEAEVLLYSHGEPFGPVVGAGDDGTFEVSFRKSSVPGPWPQADRWVWVSIVAKAPGYAPAWARVGQIEPGTDVSLRLARDDIPIQGRILSLDGRPIADAHLEIITVDAPRGGNLDEFLRTFHDRRSFSSYRREKMVSCPAGALEIPDAIRTDQQGRFELRGIGRERLVRCEVTGPDIETTTFYVVTREQIAPRPPVTRELDPFETPLAIYAATFNHFVGPSRPITGVVTGRDDEQPVPDVELSEYHGRIMHTAETDVEGRYSLEGLPIQGEFRIDAKPPPGQPYLPMSKSIVIDGTRDKLQVDFELPRGVLVKGRIINRQTQEPVKGYVEYVAFADNEHYRKLSTGYVTNLIETDSHGRFELVVSPGSGAVVANGASEAFCFAEAEEFGQPVNEDGFVATADGGSVGTTDYHRVVPIDPAVNSEPIEVTLDLRPAQKVRLMLVDGENRPVVSGVLGCSLSNYAMHPVQGGTYDVPGLEADDTRTVIFVHKERNLGAGLVVSGDSPGVHEVTLKPCPTLSGRLVDAEGRPVTDALVFVWVDPVLPLGHTAVRTDVDGRFHMTGLVPGVNCRLIYRPKPGATLRLARLSLRSGEQRDLGDLDVSQATPQ